MAFDDSDEREKIIKSIQQRFFVDADDPNDFVIVSNPDSDEENANNEDETRKKLSPLGLIERAYGMLGYETPTRTEDFEEDSIWCCTLIDGERSFQARNPSKNVAFNLAALQLIDDITKRDNSKCTYFLLPPDENIRTEILNEIAAALKSKSQFTTEQIGNKDPKQLLNEFATFYKLPKMEIKEEEIKKDNIKLFGVTALFRGQTFYAEKNTKKEAQTEVASKFVQKLDENDELYAYVRAQERKAAGKKYHDKVLRSLDDPIHKEFNAYFLDDPLAHVKACTGVNELPEITPNTDVEFMGKKSPALGSTSEEAARNWALSWIRFAFCKRKDPYFAYFKNVVPQEKIEILNGHFEEYPPPKPWENEKR